VGSQKIYLSTLREGKIIKKGKREQVLTDGGVKNWYPHWKQGRGERRGSYTVREVTL